MNDRPSRRDHSDRGPRKPQNPRGDRDQRRDDRGSDRGPRREGEFKPRRDGDFKPRRDGEFKPRRDGEFKPRRDGEFKPRRDDRGYAPRRDDDRGPRRDDRDRGPRRDGDFKPRREGDYRPRRDDDRGPRRDDRDRGPRRDDRGYAPRRDDRDRGPRRDGDFKPRREGDHRPRRDDRDFGNRRDDRAPKQDYGRGGTRGGGRSDRGGAGREFTEAERLQHQLRPVRSEHADPVLPEEIQAKDLHPSARNELKTLQADVQDRVAKHLAMVAYLIDDDPELAHQHALSASRRAGRIPVARETLAITAYRTSDFALALRELRTYRRLSGRDDHLALMVDCERGLGRPEKAIETAQEADTSKLETDQRVLLAIAVSGARLDLGQTQQALFELEIPELNPKKAFSWSPELFGAYAAVLEDLGRDAESKRWYAKADQAAGALHALQAGFDEIEVLEVHEEYVDLEEDSETVKVQVSSEAPDQAPAQETETAAEQPAAEAPAELEADIAADDAAVEPAESEATAPDASTDAMSVEDEVAELLAEAGITDTHDRSAQEAGEDSAK